MLSPSRWLAHVLVGAVVSASGACAKKQASTTGTEPRPAAALVAEHPDAIPMDDAHWEVLARDGEFVEYGGRRALRLLGGLALLRDVEMTEGVIELDLAAEPGVAFAGPVWHLQDEGTYERLYLRTFLSGSREATQYTPVANHVSGWQLYHGPDFNQKVRFERGAWIPIRVVVDDGKADLYVADANEPLLHVDPLRLGAAKGRVGVLNEPIPRGMGPANVYVSNVRVTPGATEGLRGALREPVQPPAGRIATWAVSGPFDATTLEGQHAPPPQAELSWSTLPSEPSGLANVAMAHPANKGADTVFVRAMVHSESARPGHLRLGFSERVRVYWNGQLVFIADDTWHSRDITFQGVMGWWDELVLPLQAGDNELWIAVTENVDMRGGWGVQAAFRDATGLRITAPE